MSTSRPSWPPWWKPTTSTASSVGMSPYEETGAPTSALASYSSSDWRRSSGVASRIEGRINRAARQEEREIDVGVDYSISDFCC
jgi:hypothetical protein